VVKGGLLTRSQRIGILVIAMLLSELNVALWILAVLANVTALKAMLLVWQAARTDEGKR
jgi:hypothetical protein